VRKSPRRPVAPLRLEPPVADTGPCVSAGGESYATAVGAAMVCSAAIDDSGSKINDTDIAGVACERALPIADCLTGLWSLRVVCVHYK
jgi:hypothetical protein